MKSIDECAEQQLVYGKTLKAANVVFRLEQLKKLKRVIKKFEPQLYSALYTDLGKGEFDAYSSEIGLVYKELSLFISRLKMWAKPQKVPTPIFSFPSRSFICNEPFGRVLIIGPFNFPFQLVMLPLIGAISAGNTAVIKPSENTPATSQVIEEILSEVFETKYVAVFQGGVDVGKQLLEQRWDLIFFTGSQKIGKVVMQAAAQFLTPVILELGGKNPVIVNNDANLKVAAKRIMWGKLMNAGQACVAPDYLLVHADVKEKLIQLLIQNIKDFYSAHPDKSSDFSKVINQETIVRLKQGITGCNVVYGGNSNTGQKYFSPTIVTDIPENSVLLMEEIFGPVLPILTFKTLNEAIDYVNSGEKPLSLYFFSENKKAQRKVLDETNSGGAGINEVVVHFTNNNLPFGGIAGSGMGSYHGKYSYDAFSHKRPVVKNTTFFDIPLRYPPFSKAIVKLIKILMK